ncbi:hypothetical protein [Actinokineospora diospyrosa]|uniref:Uncharacterized protein n=1 Tax=Actinokineospora diospyrosa TaxID=103728 RepID=A0ABT1IA42_9PSEU|nr:hypothetical protein [Actinokineospora diospyrosa]MCP2269513.1 hypothetical protein [Actinokineospora diospyrosa]
MHEHEALPTHNTPTRPKPAPTSGSAILTLQHQAGNHAVATLLAPTVQRACCDSCGSGGSCESPTPEVDPATLRPQ